MSNGNGLLGVDIAGLVHQHLSPRLLDAVLIKVTTTPHPTRLTGKPVPSAVPHDCKGFTGSFKVEETSDDILISDRRITLIADSLPDGVEPDTDDSIYIEGKDFNIQRVIARDPANATWTVQARQ